MHISMKNSFHYMRRWQKSLLTGSILKQIKHFIGGSGDRQSDPVFCPSSRNFSLYSISTSTEHILKLEIHPRNCNASYTIRKFNPLRRVAHAFRSNIHYKALSKNKHFTTIPSQNVTKAILYAIYTFMHI